MSQEKVDRYKKEKANRQEIMKKEKRRLVASSTALIAAIAALGIWFGVSVYQKSQPVQTEYYSTNFTALDDYMNSLSS